MEKSRKWHFNSNSFLSTFNPNTWKKYWLVKAFFSFSEFSKSHDYVAKFCFHFNMLRKGFVTILILKPSKKVILIQQGNHMKSFCIIEMLLQKFTIWFIIFGWNINLHSGWIITSRSKLVRLSDNMFSKKKVFASWKCENFPVLVCCCVVKWWRGSWRNIFFCAQQECCTYHREKVK